jgi:hypothetical protein
MINAHHDGDEVAERARMLQEMETRAQEARDDADTRISENTDGTFVVKLLVPIGVGDNDLTRVTIGRVRVRHVRESRSLGDPSNIEVAEFYAMHLVSPEGALDEVASESDHLTILRAVDRALGKYREGGRPSSR